MIFDILKYQNINLKVQAELETLPEDLVRIYWDLSGGMNINDNPSKETMCRILADWAVYIGPFDHDAPRQYFIAALKEYNP